MSEVQSVLLLVQDKANEASLLQRALKPMGGTDSFLVKPLTSYGLVNLMLIVKAYRFAMNEQPNILPSPRTTTFDHGTVSPSFAN